MSSRGDESAWGSVWLGPQCEDSTPSPTIFTLSLTDGLLPAFLPQNPGEAHQHPALGSFLQVLLDPQSQSPAVVDSSSSWVCPTGSSTSFSSCPGWPCTGECTAPSSCCAALLSLEPLPPALLTLALCSAYGQTLWGSLGACPVPGAVSMGWGRPCCSRGSCTQSLS